MDSKDFTTAVSSHNAVGMPVRVAGFNTPSSFVVLKLGHDCFGEFKAIISPDEARAIADVLNAAADFADPRVATAADLGLEAA